MNLQTERMQTLCESLGLPGLHAEHEALAQSASSEDQSYTDFLEHCLQAEQQSRQQ